MGTQSSSLPFCGAARGGQRFRPRLPESRSLFFHTSIFCSLCSSWTWLSPSGIIISDLDNLASDIQPTWDLLFSPCIQLYSSTRPSSIPPLAIRSSQVISYTTPHSQHTTICKPLPLSIEHVKPSCPL